MTESYGGRGSGRVLKVSRDDCMSTGRKEDFDDKGSLRRKLEKGTGSFHRKRNKTRI